jgi:beta-1,2-mannobiose phosphorylase / 1,2-beta-oligomannan phosphorylase
MELVAVFIAIIAALATSALFIYGTLTLVRQMRFQDSLTELARHLGLVRADENPIIVASHSWEAGGVMNPAAVVAGGKTHLFYRAVGNDGVSRIGYAWSKDGVHVDEKLPYPVFAISGTPEITRPTHAGLVASGGTWSGVGIEDPRAVIIDDRAYITFNAFAGWNSLRIGVSSIRVDDLLARRFKWSHPDYLSPPHEVQKNWLLFPEKINGKFAVLHSLHSGTRERVLVDYLDNFENSEIQSPYNPKKDEGAWDSTLRGAGPPPIKTKDGWLVLYHANDAREPHKYKLGALLLDLEDPSIVIARSLRPVLEPDAWYENDGKPGVVYACGATLSGDTLRVYYGGGDKVVCVANASLSALLKKLKKPGLSKEPRPKHAVI